MARTTKKLQELYTKHGKNEIRAMLNRKQFSDKREVAQLESMIHDEETLEEKARLSRQEDREEENLSISRKALNIARSANKIAIIAMILSVITAIAVIIITIILSPK